METYGIRKEGNGVLVNGFFYVGTQSYGEAIAVYEEVLKTHKDDDPYHGKVMRPRIKREETVCGRAARNVEYEEGVEWRVGGEGGK